MIDIIQFKPIEEQKEKNLERVYIASLPKNFFGSFLDITKAKQEAKKYRLIHLQTYQIDQALLKKIKENKNILVIALTDFFIEDKIELTKRLIRLKFLLKIVKKYNIDVRFYTLAKSPYQLKNKYELLFIAKYFGFDNNYLKKIYLETFKQLVNQE
jgi:RNase P/RNase MRP subunit p30